MFGFWRRPAPHPPQPPPEPALQGWERLQQEIGDSFRLQRQLHPHGVLEARSTATGQRVVIRCFHHFNPERFQRELQAFTRLNHPGLANTIASGVGEYAWFAREWVEGQPLSHWMKSSPVDLKLSLIWLRQLTEVLEYAHAQGALLGPLQPHNLWWNETRLVISDWTKPEPALNDHCVAASSPLGSPYGMAPEVIIGASQGPASDAYSLGYLAYDLLSGQPAYPEKDVMQLLFKILSTEPLPLSEVRPDLSDTLCHQVMALLSREPAQRPSVREVFRDPRLHLTTPSSPQVRRVLAQLQSEGKAEKVNAGFTLAPQQALQKLKNFQFPHYHMCLVALCAAAQSLKSKLTVKMQRGGLSLTYQNLQLSPPQLQELWAHALASHSSGLTHLARGLAGALGPKATRIKVASAGQGFILKTLDVPSLRPMAAGDLEIEIQGPALAGLDLKSVARRFRYARVEIQWQGLPQNRRRIPPSHPLPNPEGKTLEFALELLAPPEFSLVVDGITFELPPFELGKVIVWSQHPLDLSYQHPVDQLQLKELRQLLEIQLDQAVLQWAAQGPETIGPREFPLMQRAWQLLTSKYPNQPLPLTQEQWVDTVLQHLQRSAETPTELGELATTCLRYLQPLPKKPQLYWSTLLRRPLLAQWGPGWAEVGQIADHNFGDQTEKVDWMLQVCLDWNILSPQPQELLTLMSSIPLDNPLLIRNHDLNLAGYFGRMTDPHPQPWLNLMPESWLYARASLYGRPPTLLERTRALLHRHPQPGHPQPGHPQPGQPEP